jgi:hypothetical protein
MIDHRVYQLDLSGEDCFPGILPKRRGNRQKINKESVMKWARLLVNAQMTEEFFKENIYFVPVRWPDPICPNKKYGHWFKSGCPQAGAFIIPLRCEFPHNAPLRGRIFHRIRGRRMEKILVPKIPAENLLTH